MSAAMEPVQTATAPLDAAAWRRMAEDLEFLALLHGQELTAEVIAQLRGAGPQDWFGLTPVGDGHAEGLALLAAGLAALPTAPGPAVIDELAAEYAAIYLTHAYRAAPTESVWRDREGLERQGPMFAVRDAYRRHDLAVADWRLRSDDHLVSELAFLAAMLQEASPEALAEAAVFLRDHLLVWVPAFAGRVARRCRHPFYAGLALVTTTLLQALASLLGEATETDMTPPADEIVAAAFEATDVTGALGGAARSG